MKKLSVLGILAMLLLLGSCSKDDDSSAPKREFKNCEIEVNGITIMMRAVEGGTFTMGATPEQEELAFEDEKPVHKVTLSNFYIGRTEVTQELWESVMGNNPSYNKSSNQLPVECVSWYDCQDFISKLNTLTGEKFRLPTEAEWEYAARGGKKSKGYRYSGSDLLSNVAWHWGNKGGTGVTTHEVATRTPNELGIYDMSGNVWEWCQDWYGDYSSDAQTNPKGPSDGAFRVIRGGSWYYEGNGACRVSVRNPFMEPQFDNHTTGLRLAMSE